MERSTKRSRRHRNPIAVDEKKVPFFSNEKVHASDRQPFFQPKLNISQRGDKYEREADAIADRVISSKSNQNGAVNPEKISKVQPGSLKPAQMKIQRKAELEGATLQMQDMEEEEPVQMVEEEEDTMQMQVEEEEVQMLEEEEVQMQDEEEELQMQEEEEELQMKEKDEELQMKAGPEPTAGAKQLGSKLRDRSGKGTPLPINTRVEMEKTMGSDFREVSLHTDTDAVEMSRSIGAQAFTHGNDIYFNTGKFRPENTMGKRLLAHELTHVIQQGGVKPKNNSGKGNLSASNQTIARQGLLSPAQEQVAINYHARRFDERSRRIIQHTVGVEVDGMIGPITVEGIASFQRNSGLTENGQVDLTTLNAMVQTLATTDFHEHAIQLVVDYHNMNISDVFSIRHDSSLLLPATTFETGGLRVIRLGNFSFLSEGVLRASLLSQLVIPAPAADTPSPQPNHLNFAQEGSAISFNGIKFRDPMSIRAIQGLVQAYPDGVFGQDTVERIADFQHNNGLIVDGKVGEQSLRRMVAQLDTNNEQNAAIRMIMDFYRISEHGALLDIHFDPGLITSNATTGGIIPGPSIVKIGPPAFAQGFAGLVHTIAHELEHVRQRKVGLLNQDLREFLGERIEILSKGMPEEDINGFFDDARRALFHWNRLPANEQRIHFAKFVEVRNKVRERFNSAAAAEQTVHQTTLAGYNAVVRP